MFVLLGLFVLDTDTRAYAQGKQPQNTSQQVADNHGNTLVLESGQQSYDLARHALAVPQDVGKTGYQQVIQHYRDNQLSQTDSYPMIRLGLRSEPQWFVVPVKNATEKSRWVLDFGRLSRGRSGMLASAYVFEHKQQVEVLDALPREESTDNSLAKKLRGSMVPLNLEAGKKHLLIFYLKAWPGMPATFYLELSPQQSKDTAITAYIENGIDFGLLAIFFVLLGIFAITGRLAVLAGALFYGVHGIYLLAFEQFVFTTRPWPFYIMLLALPMAMLCCLVMLRDIYGFRRNKSGIGNWSLIALFVLTCAGALIGCALIDQGNAFIGAVAVYGAVIVVMAGALLIAASYPLGKQDNRAVVDYFHIGAWGVLGFGFISSALAHLDMLPPGVYANNAYFYTLILHGVIMTGICLILFRMPLFSQTNTGSDTEMDTGPPTLEPGGVINEDALRKSRHDAEHARLLRVIEREREILSQLRAQEKKRVEEMRAAKEAADRANEAKSAFLAVVSHEIRTPMTGIMGMVRLLENTRLTKEQSEYVATIKDSGDAMMTLLNDILDFEKIESGKLQLEKVDFDIARMLKDIHKLMSGHAKAKHSTLELKIDNNVPKYIVGDSNRLRQVLLNLVNNAIKFTEQGTVTIQLSHLGQNEDSSGTTLHQLYFAVRDTGIGISPEVQEKLFAPFSQANASITRKYGGTGLGLAICKRLVEAMGANISLQSQPGSGSTFFFTLEMPEGVAENAIEPADSAQALTSQGENAGTVEAMHVLIAEDNATNRKVIESFLNQQGHSCKSVENGKQALEKLDNKDFDILITDIEMQDMDGRELTRQLRNHSDARIANMPVVALTGNVGDEDIQNYHKAGINDVLAKPVTPEAVDHTLRRIQHGETLGAQVASSPAYSDVQQQEHGSAENARISSTKPDIEAGGAESKQAQKQARSKDSTLQQEDEQIAKNDYYDAKVLETLKSNTSADGFQDMIESVFDETEKLLMALEEALAEADWAHLRAKAHELKGMSANFGLTRIAAIAQGIEKALRRDEPLDFAGEIDALREASNATRTAVHDRLGTSNGTDTG